MRHVPFTTPPLAICTQLPAKNAGMLTLRSVTSVLPEVPLSAVPLPREGSTVARPLRPALSTVRSPYVELAPFTHVVPAPPSLFWFDVPVALANAGSVLVGSVYSTAIAPPPPAPQVVFQPPASIVPVPLIFAVVIHTEPPAPERSPFEPPTYPRA